MRLDIYHRITLAGQHDMTSKLPKLSVDWQSMEVTHIYDGDEAGQFQAITALLAPVVGIN